jgi:mono/diheme cytochrome c family protein
MNRLRSASVAILLVGAALLGAACTSTETPALSGDQADDPQLVLGRQVFEDNCARCHGGSGGGGAGPKLSDGEVVDAYPDAADQVAVVREGRDTMPSFGERLSAEEIDAVVRFTREAL